MVILDGQKFACQSCLKGHRVSGCTHTDRDLILVPKKGRPVTQCHHCRAERKKRSAHVSCDCGQADRPHHPREKCVHLREAEERSKAGVYDVSRDEKDKDKDKDAAHMAAVAEEQGCCCHHGGRCTCATLRRDADADGATLPHGPAVKPRLELSRSEGSITVFQNGHHKPVHRKNHAAHECGIPYKLPMPRATTDSAAALAVRRSVDSLALEDNMPLAPSAYTPQTSAPFNTARRLSKSEQPSPKPGLGQPLCSALADPDSADVDFATLGPSITNQSMQSAASDPFTFQPLETLSSAVDGALDPWAVPSGESGFLPNNNPFGVWPTGESGNALGQPALTAASSGTQSEIDEMPPMEDPFGYSMPSIQEDADNINFNVFVGGNSSQPNRRSLPPNFFSSSDYLLSNVNDDWQAPAVDFTVADPFKSKDLEAWTLDDSGQVPPITIAPQRSLVNGLPPPGRPASQSLGAVNAPNDDVLKQLFPEIEVNNASFDEPQRMSINSMDDCQDAMQAPNPTEFGTMDESAAFTSQSFSDGSLSIPNDPYSTTYDIDDACATPAFTQSWSQ